MMMQDKAEVQYDLLLELDQICRQNRLHYTLTEDITGGSRVDGSVDHAFRSPAVGMTAGDLERFADIVSRERPDRFVEYFLNNPGAEDWSARFCNSNTTLVNIRDYGKHINYGIFIDIVEIRRKLTGRRGRAARILQDLWKESFVRISERQKHLIPLIFLMKACRLLLGRKRVKEFFYGHIRKAAGIDSWEQIRTLKTVYLGNRKIKNTDSFQLTQVDVGGHPVSIMTALLKPHRRKKTPPKKPPTVTYEIVDVSLPYGEVLQGTVKQALGEAVRSRSKYFAMIDTIKGHLERKNQAWNTYLMTKDVVLLREIYSGDVIDEIRELKRAGQMEAYEKKISRYVRSKSKWRKKGVEFIEMAELEQLME